MILTERHRGYQDDTIPKGELEGAKAPETVFASGVYVGDIRRPFGTPITCGHAGGMVV